MNYFLKYCRELEDDQPSVVVWNNVLAEIGKNDKKAPAVQPLEN